KVIDLIGQMKVVLFAPTDLYLVDGSPEERRRFLDRALCQVQPRYCQALVQYRKIIAQRSALLKRIRDNLEDPRLMEYPDEGATTLANVIVFERLRMLSALNQQTTVLQETLSGGREQMQVVYRPSFTVDAAWNPLGAEQHFLARLREVRKGELIEGWCVLGRRSALLERMRNAVDTTASGSQ